MITDLDQELMSLALAEARASTRLVRPNPRVGCAVRAADGRVVSAHHRKAGAPHAEIEAFKLARQQGLDLKGATVAVTLEPCCHFGKTPPCTQALIQAGVARVIVALEDPFPKVAGKGIQALRQAGIEVVVGPGGAVAEAEALNREWLRAHRLGRPFFTLKMATSLDGCWASARGESRWITGERARERMQELRGRVDALVTSYRTIRDDDPLLTAREGDKLRPHQPRVFVLSQREEPDLSPYRVARHPGWAQGVRVDRLVDFAKRLYADGLIDVMIEAGPRLSTAFLDAGLVDEVWLYLNTRFLGGGPRLEALRGGSLEGLPGRLCYLEQIGPTDLFLKLEL